jgi:hypothetical protein
MRRDRNSNTKLRSPPNGALQRLIIAVASRNQHPRETKAIANAFEEESPKFDIWNKFDSGFLRLELVIQNTDNQVGDQDSYEQAKMQQQQQQQQQQKTPSRPCNV